VFKRIILFTFIGLILLDIIFVFPNGYPTISLVVSNSSPKFIIFIWLFGLLITNIFFQRTVHQKVNLKLNFYILTAISTIILITGILIKQPETINCNNFRTEIKKIEIPYVTRILCQDFSEGLSEMENCNCDTLSCNNNICDENINFKIELTVGIKFLILILGIILGYFMWPKVVKSITHNPDNRCTPDRQQNESL
ncbi:hypothetical protein, partial [Cytophaga sp. FL35]|uniref:hypothetical protein n=1 Tax=Cytophaga sp. FL35 TaxID=1904456 RepID=UPI001CA41966